MAKSVHMVTGAFGYSGKYIARRLLAQNQNVQTLTGHPENSPFRNQVQAFPYDFAKPDKLKKTLEGAKVLYNTYWIRFPRGKMTYGKAVQNTVTLLEAAAEAGVERLVHISITNPCEAPDLPYFEGKCRIEKAIKQSGLSYAIIRPTVIFGYEDILINNIAWLLRRFPVFGLVGSGNYKIRPIFVEDVAKIAVDAAAERESVTIDAIGPETYTFRELVQLIRDAIHSKSLIISLPPQLAYLAAHVLGVAVRDVLLTRDEVSGLTAGLLFVDGPATGETRFGQWLEQNAETVGRRYASELARHYR
jgi:uncharacterized protein YbjT (DUF2867 family)